MMKRFSLALSLLGFLFLSGCLIGTDLWQDHVAGPYYFWAFEAANQTQFVQQDVETGQTMASAKPITIVDAPVTAAGWNQNWVIIEQSKSSFYIFDLSQKKLHGPFTQTQFSAQKARLGVPTDLKFSKDYSTG